jgi:hypothetical protein
VTFHGAPKSSLCIVGELVSSMDDHHLESLSRATIQLGALSNFFQNILNYAPVPLSDI